LRDNERSDGARRLISKNSIVSDIEPEKLYNNPESLKYLENAQFSFISILCLIFYIIISMHFLFYTQITSFFKNLI